MNLSDHLTLLEMTRSSTAARRGISNVPDAQITANMELWAQALFEPLRDQFGPLLVTSGFRCPELNAAIGGTPGPDPHTLGCAADIHPADSRFDPLDLIRWLADSGLPFDQAILEGPPGAEPWLHLGGPRPGFGPARRELLVWSGGAYTTFNP